MSKQRVAPDRVRLPASWPLRCQSGQQDREPQIAVAVVPGEQHRRLSTWVLSGTPASRHSASSRVAPGGGLAGPRQPAVQAAKTQQQQW